MDHSISSGDDDRDLVRGSARRSEGSTNDGRQNSRQHNFYNKQRHNSRDYDARSHSSQKSDPNSETSGRGDPTHYNPSANSSVGSHGSGGGDSTRGFPLHGHVNFRHTSMSATHLLNGDPAHQFPPSLYQPSADAPKSDTATVCSGSMLEDIEDVGSHYDGDSTHTSNSKQHHHHYPPPSSILRRSDSKEGNRLVDFAERSQAVFPKQSKPTGQSVGTSQESSSASNNDDEASVGNTTQHGKGMRPPLSRHWLMQHHGTSPFRTGSVKSGGSTAGSDVVVNVGSDCGGSLTDVQSTLSQEDAALLSMVNSENSGEATLVIGSAAAGAKTDAIDTGGNTTIAMGAAASEDDEKKPHPLLCDQSDSKSGGRISPGGTIYRGRGLRRYQGRFYALPLKRFHQGGVHLHSDNEPEGNSITTNDRLHQSSNQQQVQQYNEDGDNYQWEDRHGGNGGDDYQRGSENRNYYSRSSPRHERDYNRDRNRSRSRSRSPPVEDRKRESRRKNTDFARGYKSDKNYKGGSR